MTPESDGWLPAALEDRLAADVAPELAPGVVGRDHAALRSALVEATGGGKRFRPHLVASVHRCLRGSAADSPEVPDAVLAVAAAVELLHTAFVIHDDLIDGDDTRRGRASVPGRFRAEAAAAGSDVAGVRTYGVAGSLLAGDLALAAAIRAVATCGAPAAVTARLLDLFDRALQVSADGELADVRLSLGLAEPSLAEVLTMAERKTAVYSFELPMQAGAVLAGVEDRVVEAVGQVGRQLGLAYQLLDDLRGVFGDPALTGKSELGDLREGKRTPLVVHARTTAAWPDVARHLGDPDLTRADAELVRRALEAGGSRAFIEELAAGYIDTAIGQATELGLPAELLDWLDAGSQRTGAA